MLPVHFLWALGLARHAAHEPSLAATSNTFSPLSSLGGLGPKNCASEKEKDVKKPGWMATTLTTLLDSMHRQPLGIAHALLSDHDLPRSHFLT